MGGRDEGDVRATKYARAELARRGIDTQQCDIRVMHSIVYLRGTVKSMREANISDLRSEMETIAKVLRSKAEIRDVVLELVYRS